MIEGIPVLIGDLGGWAIVTLMVVGVLTGKILAPRREVDAEKARADKWQEAWEASMATNAELSQNNRELLEYARSAAKILDVLHDRATRGDAS